MPDFIRQILINEEPFLCARHLSRFLTKHVDQDTKDFNFERVSAKNVSPSGVAERFLTMPMMAASRALVVDDFELYFKSARGKSETEESSDDDDDGGTKSDLGSLLEALKKKDVPTHVVFIATKVDKRTSFIKNFAKLGELVEFKKPYDNQVPGWLEGEARTLGYDLEPGVSALLAATAGSDLGSLVGELDKLAIYAHPETKITRRHVTEAVGTGPVDNMFELGRLLGERDLQGASALYGRMREQGEVLVAILARLIGHFRKLTLAREAVDVHGNNAPLAQILKISPFFVKDYQSQVRRFTFAELKRIYVDLMRLSESVRRSRLSDEVQFAAFLQEACLRRV